MTLPQLQTGKMAAEWPELVQLSDDDDGDSDDELVCLSWERYTHVCVQELLEVDPPGPDSSFLQESILRARSSAAALAGADRINWCSTVSIAMWLDSCAVLLVHQITVNTPARPYQGLLRCRAENECMACAVGGGTGG